MEQKRTNSGEKPIWQIWIASNYPEDNYKMLIQCESESSYKEMISGINKLIEDGINSTTNKDRADNKVPTKETDEE